MKNITFYITTVFLLLISSSASAGDADYLVLSWSEQRGLVAEFHQIVAWSESSNQTYNDNMKQQLLAFDADGSIIDQISIRDTQITRSEHHGHDQIDGRWYLNEDVTFVIRAPVGLIDHIQLPAQLDASKTLINFNNLLRQAKNKAPKQSVQQQGTVDNRINLLILGDGYTSAQQSDFDGDVDAVIAYMQTFEPYQSYGDFISYDRLFTASSESGADKPVACFGDDAVTVDTAFDGSYCILDIRRLLTVSGSKIYTAAAASPDWDEIIVIVNDQEYGGSGGGFSTFSTNSAANDIFIHEYGHSFTRLADEYDSAYPGFPQCSDISGSSCEANVTDETARNNIKWNYFIDQNTPVPTPETGQYDDVMGLFEGARYQSTGMYRPKNFCNMRTLSAGFCDVCREAYVFQLYSVPFANGNQISLLEPDSASPGNAIIDGMVSVPINLSINTLQPSHDLSITWSVNGSTQVEVNSSLTMQSFEFTPGQTGPFTVKVTAKDNSPLVHSSRQNELPEFEHTWQVNVPPDESFIFEDGFESQP